MSERGEAESEKCVHGAVALFIHLLLHWLTRVSLSLSPPHNTEDRRWRIGCRRIAGASLTSCYWTNYQNGWDAYLWYQAPSRYAITGTASYHDNGREDRRWQFRVCRVRSRVHACMCMFVCACACLCVHVHVRVCVCVCTPRPCQDRPLKKYCFSSNILIAQRAFYITFSGEKE